MADIVGYWLITSHEPADDSRTGREPYIELERARKRDRHGLVHPREVLKAAILANAAGVIVGRSNAEMTGFLP